MLLWYIITYLHLTQTNITFSLFQILVIFQSSEHYGAQKYVEHASTYPSPGFQCSEPLERRTPSSAPGHVEDGICNAFAESSLRYLEFQARRVKAIPGVSCHSLRYSLKSNKCFEMLWMHTIFVRIRFETYIMRVDLWNERPVSCKSFLLHISNKSIVPELIGKKYLSSLFLWVSEVTFSHFLSCNFMTVSSVWLCIYGSETQPKK